MKVIIENGITSLDLHGVSHQEAKIEVIDFAFRFQEELPLKVICGNSSTMRKIIFLMTPQDMGF